MLNHLFHARSTVWYLGNCNGLSDRLHGSNSHSDGDYGGWTVWRTIARCLHTWYIYALDKFNCKLQWSLTKVSQNKICLTCLDFTYFFSQGAFVGLVTGLCFSSWVGVGGMVYAPKPGTLHILSLSTDECPITNATYFATTGSTATSALVTESLLLNATTEVFGSLSER